MPLADTIRVMNPQPLPAPSALATKGGDPQTYRAAVPSCLLSKGMEVGRQLGGRAPREAEPAAERQRHKGAERESRKEDGGTRSLSRQESQERRERGK